MMAAEQQEWTAETIRAEAERLQAAERAKYFQDAEPEPGAGQEAPEPGSKKNTLVPVSAAALRDVYLVSI